MDSTSTQVAALPRALRPIAIAWSRQATRPTTVAERRQAIRAAAPRPADRGGLALDAARTRCEQIASAIKAARPTRQERRAAERLGHAPSRRAVAAVAARATPIAGRLTALRVAAVRDSFRAAGYRLATHGELSCTLTDDPADVGVHQSVYEDRDIYRGRYKGWAARVQDTRITAPRTWRQRVAARGLAVVDGLMTLDAAEIAGVSATTEVYAARWIVQGAGTALRVVTGIIARCGTTTYHADSVPAALRGLRHKAAVAEWRPESVSPAALAQLIERADAERIIVRVADARRIGACEYGIRSWCHTTGLDYERGEESLARVWAAYQQQPRREAKATILAVLRRHSRRAA